MQFKAKLVFFLDGCTPINKELEVVKRLRRKRVMINDYFSKLQDLNTNNNSNNDVADHVAKNNTVEKVGKQVFFDEKLNEYNTITVPFIKHLFLELLREKQSSSQHIKICRHLFEADNELAQYCSNSGSGSKRAKENVIVIAQDSDYFIYDSVLKYVPMYSLLKETQFSKGIMFEKEKLVVKMQHWFSQQGPFTLIRNFTPSVSCKLFKTFLNNFLQLFFTTFAIAVSRF